MSELPVWIQVLQALLTPAIALGVAAIAFMQWRTAHQKVVLDLFEQRMKAIRDVEDAITYSVKNETDFAGFDIRMTDAERQARFLFGDHVIEYLAKLNGTIYDGMLDASAMKLGTLSEAEKAEAKIKIEAKRMAIRGFRKTFDQLCSPYARMNTRRVRSPVEWFRDRNRERLGFADEKQR